jgi:tRNA A37 methylthiotransferase MiaB
MMKIYIKGLNTCVQRKQKLMQYRGFLIENGHVITDSPVGSDIIILWTCAFRQDVQDNSIAEVIRYQRDYDAQLIVVGCLPDINPELLKKNFSGRVINWRNDKPLMEKLFGGKQMELLEDSYIFIEEKICDNSLEFRRTNPEKDATFHDQFIKLVVSEGCRFNCSYCSERLMFPPYHSYPEQKLVEACRKMIEETGVKDIMLIADSVGQYGCDIGSSLPQLIRKLIAIAPGIRIALNNLNPASFIEHFTDMLYFIENNYISHLNLPIQSASAKIIKLMNRDHSREDLDRIFGLFNKMGFKDFDTHVIIGFNGETEDDFEETMRFLLHYRPRYVLASRYMEVPRMPSSKLPDKIPDDVIISRMRRFEAVMRDNNVICNIDESERMKERFQKLNS